MRCLFIATTIGFCLALPREVESQSRDSTPVASRPRAPAAATAPACCTIVRIDSVRSIITARETATGFTFRFAVKARRLLTTLRVGSPVWADFAGNSVKLRATDAAPCCAIVTKETP